MFANNGLVVWEICRTTGMDVPQMPTLKQKIHGTDRQFVFTSQDYFVFATFNELLTPSTAWFAIQPNRNNGEDLDEVFYGQPFIRKYGLFLEYVEVDDGTQVMIYTKSDSIIQQSKS